MNWRTARLGELAKPRQWPILTKAEMADVGFPVYGANGQIGYSSTFTHADPTILVGCRGSCGTVHVTPPKAYANGNAMALDALDTTRIDLWFLYFFLRTRGFDDVVSGSSQPQITGQNIVKIEVPLPPLDEQRRIAAILDQADTLRRKRRDVLTRLSILQRSKFIQMFGTKAEWNDRWPLLPILELCHPKQWTTISGDQITEHGEYPVFGANGVIGRYEKYNHSVETVLITCRGATCGTVNICSPFSWVTGNAMALDDPDPAKIVVDYLAWTLRVRGVEDAISGSAQPQITRQSLSAVNLPVPPIKLQEKFASEIKDVVSLRDNAVAHLVYLDALFSVLEHRAFHGEL